MYKFDSCRVCEHKIIEFSEKKYYLYIFTIIFIGIFFRCFCFWNIPGGGELHQDEAFAAYNAIALLSSGIDPDGYSFPIYFSSWGSGMNALESYIMIPFFYIFGVSNITIRLPMLIFNICALIVFYLICLEFCGRSRAIIAVFILSIMPWHIMASRWALESNLMPSMMLVSVYFLLKATKKYYFLLLSSCFFGISLYAYSACWPIMPIFLFTCIVYMIKNNIIKINKIFIISFICFLFISLPLILFCLVNFGFINEFSILSISIPKLSFFRSGDVDILDFFDHLKKTLTIVFMQTDGKIHNSFIPYGTYYFISIPFFIYGIIISILKSKKNKNNYIDLIMILWFFVAFILGILIDPDIVRINIIHLPIIYFISVGVHDFIFNKNLLHYVKYSIIIVFIISAFCFFYDYTTRINNILSIDNNKGLKNALVYSKEKYANNNIYLYKIFHPKILIDTKYDVVKFVQTVKYYDNNSKYRKAESFDGYKFIYDKNDLKAISDKENIVIISSIKDINDCSVLFRQEKQFDYTIVFSNIK